MGSNQAYFSVMEGLPVEEYSWKNFKQFNRLYPELNLETKFLFKGKGKVKTISLPLIHQWLNNRSAVHTWGSREERAIDNS